MGHHRLKCPDCGCENQRKFKATGQARGSYDDQVEVRCGECKREWFSVSKIALGLLRKKRDR